MYTHTTGIIEMKPSPKDENSQNQHDSFVNQYHVSYGRLGLFDSNQKWDS